MKTIFRVAKTELRTLFYSPIAWFLMIVFLIQSSIVYIGLLEGVVKQQELGGFALNFVKALTARIFVNPGGLFGEVMQKLYLYIPLLTMGLISRETSSGTIKLLYSSPIKVREIVFGKYLAMVVYSLVLVSIITLFVISGLMQIESPDTGMLMTALLGFFLLLCAYAAIGLFMSSLTNYQVVAAICTFVMIGVLSYIGNLWQDVKLVRELTYFLSISGRTQKMLGGLVTTKDVIYFIVIIYIFLGLTIYKLKAGMESKPALVKAFRYLAVIASALIIGYISSIPALIGYYDATANKTRTLTPQVQQIIAELGDEPLVVTAYNNMLGRFWSFGDAKSYNQNLNRWEPYIRFKNNIQLNTVCYYDSALDNSLRVQFKENQTLRESAEHFAKTMEIDLDNVLTPEEIRKIIDLRPELNRYVMLLEWKGRSTFLRVFNDQTAWPGETEVAAAFKRLLQAKLPKVAFLTGDLERDINKKGDKEYQTLTRLKTFRYALVNQGFDVDTLSLEEQDIPSDISTLVLADPRIALTPVTLEKLRRYIADGGNLLVTTEPGRGQIINPVLEQLGVKLMEGTVVQVSEDFSPDLVTPNLTSFAAGFSKSLAANAADSVKVSMPGVAGLIYSSDGPFKIEPLLVTDSVITWNRMKELDLNLVTSAAGGLAAVSVPIGSSDASRQVKPRPVAPRNVESTSANISLGSDSTSGSVSRRLVGSSSVLRKVDLAPGKTPVRLDSASRPAIRRLDGTGFSIRKADIASAKKSGGADSTRPPHRRINENPTITRVDDHSDAPRTLVNISGTGAIGKPRSRAAQAGQIRFSPADGDTKGVIPTAISLTREINGKQQRIVVTGDADFMSNVELKRPNMRTANFSFNTALFSWLSYGEFPIDASRPKSRDNQIYVSSKELKVLNILYTFVLPAILLIFGTVLLIRRKRK